MRKNTLIARLLALALLLAAVLMPAAALAEGVQGAEGEAARELPREDGTLQVLLKSLGDSLSQVTFTVAGSYTLNGNTGFQFARDARVTAEARENEVWLDCGGLRLNMGQSVTITRHETAGENGLYIEGSPRGKLYCGSLRLSASGGEIRPVLLIHLEEYLYGVLPYEMNDAFPMEALKAQAVAARTYALDRRANRGGKDYDVVDTTADQVFMGYDESYANAVRAVDATRGLCGLYNGKYATCYYTASNGGQTALAREVLKTSGDDGYLSVQDDPYDLANPYSPMTSLALRADAYNLPEILVKAMKRAAAEELSAMNMSDEEENIFLDEIVSVQPHTPLGGEPNRMYQFVRVTYRLSACPLVQVYSTPGIMERIRMLTGEEYTPTLLREEAGEPELVDREFSCDITVYDQLKNQLNMKISYIDCEVTEVGRRPGAECDEFVIEMRRYGHGVGMSQRGAQTMAGQHQKTCEEILAFYYPGLTFEKKNFVQDLLPAVDAMSASVALAPEVGPTPKQEELPEKEDAEQYAVVTLSTAWSVLNVRKSPSTESEVVATLANGWRVIVVGSAPGGWTKIRTGSAEGYVAAHYLKME